MKNDDDAYNVKSNDDIDKDGGRDGDDDDDVDAGCNNNKTSVGDNLDDFDIIQGGRTSRCAVPAQPGPDYGASMRSTLCNIFSAECLSAINRYRAMHQVGPLTYNDEIAKVSQAWADHLAKRNKSKYNPDPRYRGEKLGETLASHSTSSKCFPNNGAATAYIWYNEIENYNFKRFSQSNTGHFTQIVWKKTKEIGMGLAQSKGGTWFVVANYYPAGNVVGEYAMNVHPLGRQYV